MKRVVRLTDCLGLGASAGPAGLVCDPESGRYALAEAVNVDVVEGRLVRRPGYERLAGFGFSELCSGGGDLYGVAGDGLYLIPGQGQPRLLRGALTPGAPMAWLRVGDDVYYANGFDNGRLRQGQDQPWAGSARRRSAMNWPGTPAGSGSPPIPSSTSPKGPACSTGWTPWPAICRPLSAGYGCWPRSRAVSTSATRPA